MKVYYHEKMIAEAPINIKHINLTNSIDNECNIMLPYEDNNFLFSIRVLFKDVIKEAGLLWKEPNYENSKCYFYISGDKINLSIEVLPRYYSAIEKQNMLAVASDEERADGWSDYLKLMNIFDDIDEILNCVCPVGEVSVYPLELTLEEKETLFSIIK